MELTDKITNDEYAFYLGGVETCASCNIRLQEVLKIEPLLSEYQFYYMDAYGVKEFLSEQKILKIPFFMISFRGKIVEIFYTYENIITLYLKLKELVRR